jgi:glycosyltransferase involved in cell wall biosynthesis
MKADSPLASVIIPVRNSEQYLAEAIESALAQTYEPVELIVVDDGSTDQSADIARSNKGICYLYQSHQGVAVARNRGVAASQGEFIGFLDADDIWLPDKLKVQIEHLLEHPNMGYNLCRIENFLDPRLDLHQGASYHPLAMEEISITSLIVRRKVFHQIGGFDSSYEVGSDFEWVTRAKDRGVSMTILPEVLVRRRLHEANLSLKTQERRVSALRMLRESINRQAKKRS